MSAYKQQMRSIRDEYRATHEGPYRHREVAQWAIQTGRWTPHRNLAERQCTQDLTRACRDEMQRDPQGRIIRTSAAVRLKRSADGPKGMYWEKLDLATDDFMQLCFMQTRERIADYCWRLKSNVDSFNENRKPVMPVQMVFDFRNDMIEREASRLGDSTSPDDTVH
jgi:hypothetical protein